MEVSTSSVLRVSGPILRRGPSDGKAAARPRRVHVAAMAPCFEDEGHLGYYTASMRCGGRGKEEKRRSKLADSLSKNLTALMDLGFGAEALEEEKSLSEAARVLLTRLEKVRAKEKYMEKNKGKEEESLEKMNVCEDSSTSDSSDSEYEGEVAKMSTLQAVTMSMNKRKEEESMKSIKKGCEDSSSSSSESSDSSDDEEEIINMNALQSGSHTVIASNVSTMDGALTNNQELKVICKTLDASKEFQMLPMMKNGSSCSNVVNTAASSKSILTEPKSPPPTPVLSEVAALTERIEICMGGKCKKSGALQLKEEFEKHVGEEGAVVACKCMGKCKEGPNVRIRSNQNEEEATDALPSNPLCIGVGLADVGTIVSTYFGERCSRYQTCGA